MTKRRLDLLLVERGLARSRQEAQALIMSGRVMLEGRALVKPGTPVAGDAPVAVSGPPAPFVGRGGVKLAGALDRLGLDVAGLTAIDIGASTGGFTDCLLQRGAKKVFAVDVGRGQLDWRLRNDPRVVVIEKLNARRLEPANLPGLGPGSGLVVIDVSFISLRHILPRVPALLCRNAPGACVLALVKPQFEVGRRRVGRGGIVREPLARREAVSGIVAFAGTVGLGPSAIVASPIAGAEGNREYFIHLEPAPAASAPVGIEVLLDGVSWEDS